MTEKHGLLYDLALFKQRYTRGTSWTQIVLNFGIITANAKLFEDFFSVHLGLTLPMVKSPRGALLYHRLLYHRAL